MPIRFSPIVKDALDHGYPVVGLESSIITHALPANLRVETALAVEANVLAQNVVPATVGILDGEVVVGMSHEEIVRLATDPGAVRLLIRDLPFAMTKRLSGGTSLGATVHLTHRAGITVAATTGLGGVHHASGAHTFLHESSDLTALSIYPIVLVASGIRPMLDLAATLERFEALSIPVLGYRTDYFPGYYVRESGYRVDWRIDDPGEVADLAKTRGELQLPQAMLVVNPIDPDHALVDYETKLAEAATIANTHRDAGAEDTAILLHSLEEATQGDAIRTLIACYHQNAALASQIAKKMATTPHYTD